MERKSLLIKDTTVDERMQIVKESLCFGDGECEGVDMMICTTTISSAGRNSWRYMRSSVGATPVPCVPRATVTCCVATVRCDPLVPCQLVFLTECRRQAKLSYMIRWQSSWHHVMLCRLSCFCQMRQRLLAERKKYMNSANWVGNMGSLWLKITNFANWYRRNETICV